MRGFILVVVAGSLLLPAFVGAPAAASVPPVVPPTEFQYERNDTRVGGVVWRNVTTFGTYIEEYCLKQRLLCVGPYEIDEERIPLPRAGVIVENDMNATASFNQSGQKLYGPYEVEMPIGHPIRICYYPCVLPAPFNATLNTSTDVTVVYQDTTITRGVDFAWNWSEANRTYTRVR